MAEDYAENLFQAVDTIVNERIKNLPYDRTIRAKIYDNSQAYYGLYQVTTNDVDYFNAYSDDISYNIGDEVYVRIPKAEYTEQKVIIGKYIPEIEIKNTNNISNNKRFYIARSKDSEEEKDYITYAENNGQKGYLINSDIRLDSYQLFLYNVSAPKISEYSPDDSNTITQTIQAVLVHYVSEDGILYADEYTNFSNGHYMIDDGTTTSLSYSQILDGQYNEIGITPQDNRFTISFTPNRQFVHPYVVVHGYTTVASGAIIVAEYPLIFKANEQLSSKYRSFLLNVSSDQFFNYNAKGKWINNNTNNKCVVSFTYVNILDEEACFDKNKDNIIIERINNSSNSLLQWGSIIFDNNDGNKATLELTVDTEKILSASFYVERLSFTIIKDNVTYILNKDFYFGYKQIDSDNNTTTFNLYLNDNDTLKYQKLLVGADGKLINISPNGVTLGGKSLTESGNWAGNAATATTSTNLVNKPSFTANNNTITVTVGGKTSDAFTVPFATNATNATKLTTETVGNGKQIISFTSGVPTVSAEHVGYDNQKPQPIYLNNGTLTTVPVIKIDNINYTINEAITKIIAALTNNIQLKNNRTLWQDT